MRPRTICHPEALNDWRANDEAAPAYDWQGLYKYDGETEHASIRERRTYDNKISKEQKEHRELLLRRIEEALELEARRCGAVRKEGET